MGDRRSWTADITKESTSNRTIEKKTSEKDLIKEFEALFLQCKDGFKQSRTVKRALDLAYGLLTCMGRRTITGMLTSSGQQFKDWTAAYRLFDGERMDVENLFSVIRKTLTGQLLYEKAFICAHMDDTHIRKRGRKVAGTSWQRDPLGPPFHTNFIWGQRFIQLSISLPEGSSPSRATAIPVDFHHCPPVKKPKKNDNQDAWKQYREKQKRAKLSQVGSQRIKRLRDKLNEEGMEGKPLIINVDNSYTNETVVKGLPENVTLIGRVRKDCAVYALPDTTRKGVGRNRDMETDYLLRSKSGNPMIIPGNKWKPGRPEKSINLISK